jgi:Tol biopolymer transport system component
MLELVPPSSGVRFFKNGLIFLSLTKNEAAIPGHISFGNAETYFAILRDSVPGTHELFSEMLPFPYPSDGITFNGDYTTMYFTGYSRADKSEKIYRADFTPQKEGPPAWTTDAKPLDFCESIYTYTHPALTYDGKTMIFASDMSGSRGGLDLFITRRENEKWSVPENAGNMVNSDGNELYPSFDRYNNLYFSSDRQPGFGGYDIYVCLFNGSAWDKPVSLDNVINSENDDIAFTLNRTDGKTAFYTVKERSGKGRMQLYRISAHGGNYRGNQYDLPGIFSMIIKQEKSLTGPVTGTRPLNIQKDPSETEAVVESSSAGIRISEQLKQNISEGNKEAGTGVLNAAGTKVTEIKSASSEAKTVKSSSDNAGDKALTAAKPSVPVREGLVYRIQIFSNMKPKGSYRINFGGKTYNTFEYLHNGAYRTCIGEFSDLKSATDFQNILRKSGYPQAFVIALVNNVRSVDPALFR